MEDNYPTVDHSYPVQEPRRSYLAPLVLGAGLLGLGGFSFYQHNQTEELRRQLATYQQDTAALRTSLSSSDQELQKTIVALREDLASARTETSSSIAKSQATSRRQADVIAGRLEKQLGKQIEERAAREQEFTAELTKVKESTSEANTKITGISTEVTNVKTEVATTKSDLQKTLSDLMSVRGDMGVMSGLIATNGKEIQALRELGDRNIYEFTLSKKAGPQRVGDIQVALKKADVKRNRYTMEVVADDKRVEKKDRGMNEPVQFYVASKARQPYEIVVNQVSKDTVVGYLSTPKVTISRADTAQR
jgi:chromosome segregation ATPase